MALSDIYTLFSLIPLDCMQSGFMQRALFGLLLLAPMTAVMGVQVVNLRMAFFSDAISHSAFAGAAVGLLCGVSPHFVMPVFGVAVGVSIMALLRSSSLSSDTVIGVMYAAVMAFGLAVVSRTPSAGRSLQQFLYGDILTITDTDLGWLCVLFAILAAFQMYAYNRLLYIGLHPLLARVHGVPVRCLQYAFAALLSVVVMFSVWAVGVLLVTALLIVPAAAARNLALTAASMLRWAVLIGTTSAAAGLLISAQDGVRTAAGSAVILCACAWFAVSAVIASVVRKERMR
ncbi:MAG: metal ABC transporter permease [Desulfovibrionaceae bacterium]|nr:metal ABC transporter permease [Desulfovibrionaceae bacterium]